MSTTADIDHPRPDQAPDPALDARAAASLGALFGARPALAADLGEAGRALTHLEQERQREADAQDALTRAEQHASGTTARLDLAGHRFAGFTAGAVAVAILLVFDTVPLNWAAQAFGLAAAATWLVTGIMLVASAGAMAGLELTREDARRRGALLFLIAAGFAALAVLRTAVVAREVARAAVHAGRAGRRCGEPGVAAVEDFAEQVAEQLDRLGRDAVPHGRRRVVPGRYRQVADRPPGAAAIAPTAWAKVSSRGPVSS